MEINLNNWIKLDENSLPLPNTLVWVKRKTGNIYLASRMDKPIATNNDASKNCYWYGNPLDTALKVDNPYELKMHYNFSDITVDSWMYVQSPLNQ